MISRASGRLRWHKVASVYVGSVIGAGFATGREIWTFFGQYGLFGGAGLVIATMLFSALAPILMGIMRRRSLCQYGDLYRCYLPGKSAAFVDVATTIYFFGVLAVMFTGSVVLMSRIIGVPHIAAALIIWIGLAAVASRGLAWVATASALLSPVLVAGIVLLSLDHLARTEILTIVKPLSAHTMTTVSMAFLSALVYVSYNMLMCVGVFGSMVSSDTETGVLVIGSVVGGLALGLLSFLVFMTVTSMPERIAASDMPLLADADRRGGLVYMVYLVAVLAAMVTTALSMLISLTTRLLSLDHPLLCKMSERRWSVFLTTLCIPVSYVGFATLIDHVYVPFGVFGLAILTMIFRFDREAAGR